MKRFQWLLFSMATGEILKTLIPATDKVKLDINATEEADLTIPFSVLTNAQRNNWATEFELMDRGIALFQTTKTGELAANAEYAGPIIQREYDATNEELFIKAGSVMDYFARVPLVIPPKTMTTRPKAVQFKGANWFEVYEAMVLSAVGNTEGEGGSDWAATSRAFNVPLRTPPASPGAVFNYEPEELNSLMDMLEYARDERSASGKPSTEFIFKADSTTRPGFITFKLARPNSANTELPVNLFEDRRRKWEPTAWNISDDGANIFTALYINGSSNQDENDFYMAAVNKTPAGRLTLFDTFDAENKLSPEQMAAQLDARIKNSRVSEKDTVLTISGDIGFEWRQHLGKTAVFKTGPRTQGSAVELRIVEITFSTQSYDTSIEVSLMELADVYPTLPREKKKEAAGGNGRKPKKPLGPSSAGFKKPEFKPGLKGGGIGGGFKVQPGVGGGFEIDPKPIAGIGADGSTLPDGFGGIGGIGGGGIDTPETEEPKPEQLKGAADTELTLFNLNRSPLTVGSEHYGSRYWYSNPFYKEEGDAHRMYYLGLEYASTHEALIFEEQIPDMNIKAEILKSVKILPGDFRTEAAAAETAPDTVVNFNIPMAWIWDNSNPVKNYTNIQYRSGSQISQEKMIVSDDGVFDRWYFSLRAFVVNGRPYFYGTYTSSKIWYAYVPGTYVSEVFFTADFNEDMTGLENFTKLKSPAEQLWDSNGQHKLIAPFSTAGAGAKSTLPTRPDFFENGSIKSVIFPYTEVYSSRVESRNGIGFVYSIFHPEATEQWLGVDRNISQGIFGWLEGDFSARQPVWKESAITPPWPRVRLADGYMLTNSNTDKNTSINQDSWNFTEAPAWNGRNNWGARENYSAAYTSSYYGLVASPHFAVGERQAGEYWQLESAADIEKFEKEYVNYIWLLPRGSKEWKKIELPTEWTIGTAVSLFGTAMPDETLMTYIHGEPGAVFGMNGAGKRNRIIGSDPTADGSPARGFTGNSLNPNHPALVPYFDLTVYGYLPGYALMTPSPYKMNPKMVTDSGFIQSEEGLFISRNVYDYANLLGRAGVSSDDLSKPITIAGADFVLTNISTKFKAIESVAGYALGIDNSGGLWEWGIKPEVQAVYPVDPDDRIVSPRRLFVDRKFEAISIGTIARNSSNSNARALAFYAIGEDKALYAWGRTDGGDFKAIAKISAGSKKFKSITARGTNSALAIDEDMNAWTVGAWNQAAAPGVNPLSDSAPALAALLDGKIVDVKTRPYGPVTIYRTAAGKVYLDDPNQRGLSEASWLAETPAEGIKQVTPPNLGKIIGATVDSQRGGGNRLIVLVTLLLEDGMIWNLSSSSPPISVSYATEYKFTELHSGRGHDSSYDGGPPTALAVGAIKSGLTEQKIVANGWGGGTFYAASGVVFGGETLSESMTPPANEVPSGEGGAGYEPDRSGVIGGRLAAENLDPFTPSPKKASDLEGSGYWLEPKSKQLKVNLGGEADLPETP